MFSALTGKCVAGLDFCLAEVVDADALAAHHTFTELLHAYVYNSSLF